MISIQRLLSFEDYTAASKIALKNGDHKRRRNYFLCTWVLPFIGAIGLPATLWQAVHVWNAPGENGLAFGGICGLSFYLLYLLFLPLAFRRRMKKSYQQQEFHREWLIEVSDEGIHTAIEGLADSRLEWPYFDLFVETEDLFVLVKKVRPVFISLPKSALTNPEQADLRKILCFHLTPR